MAWWGDDDVPFVWVDGGIQAYICGVGGERSRNGTVIAWHEIISTRDSNELMQRVLTAPWHNWNL